MQPLLARIGLHHDILSAILIVTLLPLPAVRDRSGYFGIIFIVNLGLAMTPPMGINLFVASTVLTGLVRS